MTTDSPTSATTLSEQADRPRFPYVTAYLGFYIIINLIVIPYLIWRLVVGSTPNTLVASVFMLVSSAIIFFFALRWVAKKHIMPYVSVDITPLQKNGDRLNLRNPFIMGTATYMALNALVQILMAPLSELLFPSSAPPLTLIIKWLVYGFVGFFPFAAAIKYVVLKPYRLRRLLPFLGLLILLNFSTDVAIAAAQARQEWAFRNQVYCEILKPGMTKAEVDAALKPLGLRYQINWGREAVHGPTIPQADTFTEPTFDAPDIEYGLLLVLGYNNKDQLVMVGRRRSLSFNYEPIECPLPFR
jgi:hypothetical protein